MIRLFAALLALILLPFSQAAAQTAGPDAETIIARHIEARGGAEALHALHSLVFDHGVYREGDFTSDGTAVMMLMRPYYKLVGHPEREPGFMEGYDGTAWEWYQDPGLTVRTTGPASAASRHSTDVEGPFLDYADKGSSIELLGSELIAGRPAYQIRLTQMDGFATDYFIDQESYLISASRRTAPIHAFGEAVTTQSLHSDYRRVAGVLFPFAYIEVELASGAELNSMRWGEIEADRDLPVAWFSPPEYERTPIQTFMEQLYLQRSDAAATLWTYAVFRRAHPGTDTRGASEAIGYQMLKMDEIDTAIALLERNAADYPGAADSAFGLGRAYATAGRAEDARAEFTRALELEPGHARAMRGLAELEDQ
tara:strand:- start:9123 stop:10226 length:1104 start_codon:yes stop_codon:yes gene_type:complete